MDANFEKCLEFVLGQEGGFVPNTRTPGLNKYKGITLVDFTQFTGVNQTVEVLQAISDQTVREYYIKTHWNPSEAVYHPDGVDLSLFNAGVMFGPRRAIEFYNRTARSWGVPGTHDNLSIERFIVKFAITIQNWLVENYDKGKDREAKIRRLGEAMDRGLEMAREAWSIREAERRKIEPERPFEAEELAAAPDRPMTAFYWNLEPVARAERPARRQVEVQWEAETPSHYRPLPVRRARRAPSRNERAAIQGEWQASQNQWLGELTNELLPAPEPEVRIGRTEIVVEPRVLNEAEMEARRAAFSVVDDTLNSIIERVLTRNGRGVDSDTP